MAKRLIKSTDKKVFGVAGGLAEYFDVTPNLIRVGFVVLGVCSLLVAIVVYLALAVTMPSPSTAAESSVPGAES